jgi:hypothetical protein
MHEPVSFRNGIDGMAAVARLVLGKEPMSGGFWLCTRRLSKGTFTHWPTSDGAQPCSPLLARDLQVLIWGGDPSHCSFPELWRKVA